MPLFNFICHIKEIPTIGSGLPDKDIISYSFYQEECKDLYSAISFLNKKFFVDIDDINFKNNKEVWVRVSGGFKSLKATNTIRNCDLQRLIYQYVQILEFNELNT